MLPIPAATTTLAEILPTSQPVANAFFPYAYMEIGVVIAALVIIFLIALFSGAIERLIGADKYHDPDYLDWIQMRKEKAGWKKNKFD